MNRANLEVMTHAQVDRLVLEGRRVTGVDVRRQGQPIRVGVRGEAILSAGSIGSPQILQLSGIGPGALLRQHGIAVQHDLAGVGENLQDHLQIRCAYKVQGVKTLNERTQTLWGKAMIGLEYAIFQSGPMSMSPSQLGCFAKSDASRDTPNLQYHVQPLTLEKFGEPLASVSRRSRRASATCGPTAGAGCASRAPIRWRIPKSGRTISRPKATAASPPTASS